jgi:hypothetical protein
MQRDVYLEELWRSRAHLETRWIGGSKWELEVIPSKEPYADISLEIRRNGVVKQKLGQEDFFNENVQVGRGWYPVGYPVFIISDHTGVSHGQLARFYAVIGARVEKMFEIYGEYGGPVFRDLDGDGKFECVFDNFECPAVMRDPPAFLVYKQHGHTVKFWTKLPNPQGVYLPTPAVRYHRRRR